MSEFNDFPDAPTAGTTRSEFDDFPDAAGQAGGGGASLGQQATAAVEAGGRSALETSGFMGGAMLGAGGGAAVAGPPGAFVGGLAGGIAGFMAGELAGESAGLRSPEQMPPAVRPGAYFGQTLGGAVPIGTAPVAAAISGFRFGESMVGRFLNQIIETAKTQPLRFGAAEASSAVSAGLGAATAEAVAPGRADIRANAEIAAGIANPTRLTLDLYNFGKNIAGRALQTISPGARETAAAKQLTELLRVTGEDPTAIARVLRSQGVIDSDLTAAQKSGSVALGALEQYLGKVNQQFGAEVAQKARDGLDVIRGQITLLTATGDPAALEAAATLRQTYFRTLISGRVEMAKNEALRKAGRIARDTPDAREKLSVAARDALETSIADARATEKQFWERVDGTRPAQTTNLQQTFDEIVADALPELRNRKTPTVVKQFLDRVNTPGEGRFDYDPETMSVREFETAAPGTNIDEMRKLRSELLSMARAAARDPDQAGMERIYSQLAEATLDDMDAAFKGTGDNTYNEARAFSKELNDTFTRSFAGKVVAEGKYGDRVAPEILLRKALATGKEAGALQLAELEEATRFLPSLGLGNTEAYTKMMDAQERMFRLAAADSLDPLTGRASPERIAKFVRDNATLMKRFPEVKADLLAASKSEMRLRTLENRAKGVDDILSRQADFGKLIGGSGTTGAGNVALKAANRALLSVDQEGEITRLINVAKGGGTGRGGRIVVQAQDAINGLRASIFQAAVDRSTRGGVLDINLARQMLFTPTSAGRKSPMDIMLEQKVIDQKQVAQIRKFFDAAESIQRSQRPGTAVQVQQDMLDVTTATISRMIGSGVAGAAARGAGSNTPSLIVHGAGARLAEQVMTKFSVTSVNKVLTEAMNDPEKMALLLTKAKTPEEAAFQARQIHAWLVQSNIINSANMIQRDYEQPGAQQPQMFSIPR